MARCCLHPTLLLLVAAASPVLGGLTFSVMNKAASDVPPVEMKRNATAPSAQNEHHALRNDMANENGSEAASGSGSTDMQVGVDPRRATESKLSLGSMGMLIGACIFVIALAFVVVYHRKKSKKSGNKKRKEPPEAAPMSSAHSTTANATYFELPKDTKPSDVVSTVPSQPQVRTVHSTGMYPVAGRALPAHKHATTSFVSTNPDETHGPEGLGGLTTIRLSDSPLPGNNDSTRSIAGVMKTYRGQNPEMFDDRSGRQTSLSLLNSSNYEFTIDTGGRTIVVDDGPSPVPLLADPNARVSTSVKL